MLFISRNPSVLGSSCSVKVANTATSGLGIAGFSVGRITMIVPMYMSDGWHTGYSCCPPAA